ncbi:MAG: phosphate ABC transporter substrate-binding protein PstS [Roseiflexaceae bacterium]
MSIVTRKIRATMLSLAIASALLLSACSSAPAAVEPTAVPEVAVEATAAPEATAIPEATAVPEATATTEPTKAPEATAATEATATMAATQAATATKAAMTAPTATTAPVVAATEWEPRQLTAKLSGSGASFPNPLYQVWISVYTKNVVPGVQLSYSSVGSGQGQKDFIAYLTDFGGSDSAIKSGDVESKAPDAIHLPMVMGGVMPMVNIAGIKTPLKFTAETLAGIYLGAITNWNDPRLAKDNEGVALPDLAITPVYRSDSSGTTSIWTDYLSKISTDWKSKVGSGSAVSFPAGIGASGNAGVSATVLNTNGAVGYVEVGYALAAGFPLPYVKNASGNFVKPETNNVSAAANGMNISSNPQKLASSITNSAAPDAYPIAAFTYILVRQKTYTDVNKAQALADFIYWGLTTGQGATVRLGYAPLPEAMRTASMKALKTVTVNGAPVIDAPIK